jgi:hypothetical protein
MDGYPGYPFKYEIEQEASFCEYRKNKQMNSEPDPEWSVATNAKSRRYSW